MRTNKMNQAGFSEVETMDEVVFTCLQPKKLNDTQSSAVYNFKLAVERKIRTYRDDRNWAVVEIPLDLLEVDLAYQREPRNYEVAQITNEFDMNRVEIKAASIRKVGKTWHIYLMDGAHTLSALLFMRAMGFPISGMVCKVFVNLTQKDEARLFASQNKGKTNLRGYERYKAELCGECETAVAIDKVLKEFGLTTKVNYNSTINRNHNVNAIEELYRIVEKNGGEEGLRFVFSIIQDLGWDGQTMAYTQRVLAGISSTYKACKDNAIKRNQLILGMKAFDDCDAFLKEAQNTDKYEGHPAQKVRAYLNGLIG